MSAPSTAALAPIPEAAPSPAAAACPTAPSEPRSPLAPRANREAVSPSAALSPEDRPFGSVADAAPVVPSAPPGSIPWTPPWAASPVRRAAPELVPGSTNARSLNSASGLKQPIRMRNTPGTAVPMALWSWSTYPRATPDVICTPSPKVRIISTGVRAAAWNQRRLFQNHDRPASETRPAAAIGVAAASTISAPARVSMTRACPIAASTRKMPIRPRTVAIVPSVMSEVENGAHGCQADKASTWSSDRISALVSPPAAARTATAYTIQAAHTMTYWPAPRTARARLRPSRRSAAVPSWTMIITTTRDPAIQNVTG